MMSGSNGLSYFEYALPVLFISSFVLLLLYQQGIPKYLASKYSFEIVQEGKFHKLGDTLSGTISLKLKSESTELRQQAVDVVGYFGLKGHSREDRLLAPKVGGEIFRTQVLLTQNADALTGNWSITIPQQPKGVSWDGSKISIEQTYQTPYLGSRQGWFQFRDPSKVTFYVGVSILPYMVLTRRFFHWKEIELDLTHSGSIGISPAAVAAAKIKKQNAPAPSEVDVEALKQDPAIARALASGNQLEVIQLIRTRLDVSLEDAMTIYKRFR